jgi:WD40 repeat protein
VADVASFKVVRELKVDQNFLPNHILFKPGSTDAIAALDTSGRVHCWLKNQYAQINQLPLDRGQRTAMLATPDGKHLLVAVNANPNYIHRYQFELHGLQTPHQYDGATNEIVAVGGSEGTGRIVAVTGGRYGNSEILTWGFSAKSKPKVFPTNDRATVAAVTGDGHYALLGGQDGRVALYDVDQQQVIERFDPHLKNMGRVEAIAITYDGRFAVSGGTDEMVYRYQLPTVCW